MTAPIIAPPSTSLPPLKRLSTYTPALLSLSIRDLSLLYHPGSEPTKARIHDSGYASVSSSSVKLVDLALEDTLKDEWTRLRSDGFERDVAMRWLTGLVAKGEGWMDEDEDEQLREDKERLLDDAAALLATCSRTSEAGTLRRKHVFVVGAPEDLKTITVSTRDESYTGDDHAAVGVQTWASSSILADMIARDPPSFGIPLLASSSNPTPSATRILELGAGTGVLSLLLASLATSHNPACVSIEIVATDYHPAVLANLSSNLLSNFPTQPPHLTLSCLSLDWSLLHAQPDRDLPSPFDRPFDVIVGADIIYEQSHCAWIYSTVCKLLGKEGVFHLIMPLRPTHTAENTIVRDVLPFAKDMGRLCGRDDAGSRAVLAVTQMTETERAVGKGRADEVKYEIFRMEWVYLPIM